MNKSPTPAETPREDFLWRFSNIEFDEATWQLRVSGVAIEAEPKPLDVLAFLLRHAGEVVTRDELFAAVWPGVVVVEKVLTNTVVKLRKAIGDDNQSVITTVHKIGYRLAAPVTRKNQGRRRIGGVSFNPGDAVPGREQWRLRSPLGASARADVWLATHAETGEKRVFKFCGDSAMITPLKREATLSRILAAAVDHPGFVRILEWNFENPPYFLESEYGGLDWIAWAESQGGLAKVPLATRLELFGQAAEIVAAAHSVGVLHKDLKPANLLIQNQRDGLRVRLTDFGNARLLDPALPDALGVPRMTQTAGAEALTGTPLYVAPELLAGQFPSQASDVYSLGVVLYQMVVGDLSRPFAPGWEKDVDDELLRTDIAAAASGDPAARLDSAAELARRLRALDARAVERARALRQQQAHQALLQREQRRRARRPWLAALALTLLLGAGLVLRYYRDAARAAGDEQVVSQFLFDDLLAGANPRNSGSSASSIDDAVLQAAAHIDSRFAGKPLQAARAHSLTGWALHQLSRFEPAIAELRLAADLYLRNAGPNDRDTWHTEVLYARALATAGRYDEAGQALAQVEGPIRAAHDQRYYGEWLETEGLVSLNRMHYDEAIAAYEEEVRLQPQAIPEVGLAIAYTGAGRYDKARETQARILALDRARYGWDSPDTVDARTHFLIDSTRFEPPQSLLPEFAALRPAVLKTWGADWYWGLLALRAQGETELKLGAWTQAADTLGEALTRLKNTGRIEPDQAEALTQEIATARRQAAAAPRSNSAPGT